MIKYWALFQSAPTCPVKVTALRSEYCGEQWLSHEKNQQDSPSLSAKHLILLKQQVEFHSDPQIHKHNVI